MTPIDSSNLITLQLRMMATVLIAIHLGSARCQSGISKATALPRSTVQVIEANKKNIILAGEQISFTYVLDEEVNIPDNATNPVAANLSASFNKVGAQARDLMTVPPQTVSLFAYFPRRGKKIELVGQLARNQTPGMYELASFYATIGNKTYDLKREKFSFEVVANLAYAEYIPPVSISGELSLNLTKAQLLRSKAAEINERLGILSKELKGLSRIDIVRTRATLLRQLHAEHEELLRTRAAETQLEKNPNDKAAAEGIFSDFEQLYNELINRLQEVLISAAEIQPTFATVSYADRSEQIFQLKDETLRTIEMSRTAFLLMAGEGNFIHSLRIETQPTGANLSYSTRTEVHTCNSLSDTEIDSLRYGLWTIKAVKGDLYGEVDYNPYDDSHRVVQIFLKKKASSGSKSK